MPEFRVLQRDVAELKRAGGGSLPASEPGAPPSDVRARLADLAQEVDALRDEVARLTGDLEEARYLARQALQEAEALRRTGAVPRAGAGELALTPGGVVPGGSPAAAVPGTGVAPPQGATGVAGVSPAEVRGYEDAFRIYRAGDYATAAARFQEFLQEHPRSDYADNAMFWMGECHFKLGDHVLAAVTFEKVSREYPDGNKVPDALYRQGIALLSIGEAKGEEVAYASAAREIFQRILDEHPRSDRVDEARRQLEKLR